MEKKNMEEKRIFKILKEYKENSFLKNNSTLSPKNVKNRKPTNARRKMKASTLFRSFFTSSP